MDHPTCIKYLDFLASESKRLQRTASQDDLISYSVEVNRFKEQVDNSSLPVEVKASVAEIQINYSSKQENASILMILFALATGGLAFLITYHTQKGIRIGILKRLENEIIDVRQQLVGSELSLGGFS